MTIISYHTYHLYLDSLRGLFTKIIHRITVLLVRFKKNQSDITPRIIGLHISVFYKH